jgi:hypothetical protein
MGKSEDQMENMKQAHPVDASLFGTVGAYTAALCMDVTKDFNGKQFEFIDVGKFQQIKDIPKLNQVYWRELLFRVYWAAALNLMRHQRWQAACTTAFSPSPNLLNFAGSLRGLIEASVDAYYSLGPVPATLADNQELIESALQGKQQYVGVVEELEHRLIHFVYGRKINKSDKHATPSSHVALEPREYRNAIGLPEMDRTSFAKLYDELCGYCHPTGFSLAFLWHQKEQNDVTTVRITDSRDYEGIEELCRRFESTIQFALSLSVTTSSLCLKALNRFSLMEVRNSTIERWNFDDIPAWRNIRDKLRRRS